jgi:hypothetical protein
MHRLLPLLLLLGAAPAAETRWFVILAGNGDRIGRAEQTSTQTAQGRETRASQEIWLRQDGAALRKIVDTSITRYDSAGRLVSIEGESRSGTNAPARVTLRIVPAGAEIARTSAGHVERRTIPLPAGVRFDSGTGLLPGWKPGAAPRLEFDNLNLDAGTIEHVVIDAVPGAPGQALRRRYEKGQLRAVARLTLDSTGSIIALVQPMFGTAITIRPAPGDEALAPLTAYRPLSSAMVKAPFRIPAAAMQGHIRYRLSFQDGIAFDPPATPEQRVTRTTDGATLDICADCGSDLPSDPATLADALKPTRWLQSDDRRIRAEVASIARMKVSDRRKMELLTARAAGAITQVDFIGHHSALEALRTGRGDCTESAALLAAYGRAAGIPTRVANGLAYSREAYHGVSNVFMPHSWVLAFVDGHWRSFDSALGQFDATHIALTLGDGDAAAGAAANQLAGLLVWQDMAEIRTRPGD